VPIDGDDGHTTAVYFRQGQAWLRSEAESTEYRLSKLPRTDGKPTRVRVLLDRSGSCRAQVWLDGELAASTSAGECMSERDAFVEYGLYLRDPRSGPLRAYYDDVAFTRE
jgi:hypothetical protein